MLGPLFITLLHFYLFLGFLKDDVSVPKTVTSVHVELEKEWELLYT